MRFGVHVVSLVITAVLVTVFTHEQHMKLSAYLIVITYVGFAVWMVLGTIWWLVGMVFRRDD